MTDSLRVDVALGDRSYPIEIGSGTVPQFGDAFAEACPDATHAIVIVDSEIADSWGRRVIDSFRSRVRVSPISVTSGEGSKSFAEFERILAAVLDAGGDRRSVIVAVGGGVVGDLAGYVAASFARGIRFVQVPTTLLAMVDSSVGGKTGINLPGAKNMVGAFWQPRLVFIDTRFLNTLPPRILRSGLAEVIKYGVIEDPDFFTFLETHGKRLLRLDPATTKIAIATSCRCKAAVVGDDERETSGRRAILNYGHTFAHALEATAGYGVLQHGEAVAVGMQMAARLAFRLNWCEQDLLDRQTALIADCGLPTEFPDADGDAMLPVMARDKKVEHGRLRFVLPRRIGHVELISDIDEADVRHAIRG